MRPENAVTVALLRQAALLDAVAGDNSSLSEGQAEAEAWHSLGVLRYASRTDEEREQKDLLLQAIARRKAALSVADRYAAQRGQQVYDWLGRDLPSFDVLRNTYPVPIRHATVSDKATLLVVQQADAADVPALLLAVDSLRARLAPGTQAKLILTGSPSAAAGKQTPNTPVAHAIYTGDDLLTLFAAESGPLFLVVDAANHIVWLGTGTTAWLNPQQQAEVLLERASAK